MNCRPLKTPVSVILHPSEFSTVPAVYRIQTFAFKLATEPFAKLHGFEAIFSHVPDNLGRVKGPTTTAKAKKKKAFHDRSL